MPGSDSIGAAFPLSLESTFPGLYGLQILSIDSEEVVARVRVRDAVRQPMGLVAVRGGTN